MAVFGGLAARVGHAPEAFQVKIDLDLIVRAGSEHEVE
jgi:hypothetical protein